MPRLRRILALFIGALCTPALVPCNAVAQVREFELEGDRQWQEVDPPEEGTDEWTMAEARRLLAEDEPKKAKALLSPWIEKNERQQNEWLAQAYLLRGDALVAMGREFSALYDYERVAQDFWGSQEFALAARRELDIAKEYVRGKRIRVAGLRIAKATEIAVELLIRVQERLPGSDVAEEASIELAEHYYRERDMKLAREAYDLYLINFPQGGNRAHAQQRLIQTDIAGFKGPRYDASGLLDARVRIRDFVRAYPVLADQSGVNEALLVRIDESLAAQLLDSGRWYLRTGDWPAARLTLRRLIRDHPQSVSASEARRLMESKGWEIGAAEDQEPLGEPVGDTLPDQAALQDTPEEAAPADQPEQDDDQ